MLNSVSRSPRLFGIAAAVLIVLTLPSLRPVVSAQEDTRMVVFGTRHAVALKNNGDVLTWGENVSCQLGRAAGNRSATPGQVLRNIREVVKALNEAAAQKTYAMLKQSDPAGAEKFLADMKSQAEEMKRLQQDVYPATTAQAEGEVRDYEQYRASFTADQLRPPAVWGDPSDAGRRKLDADIAALQALPPAVQAQLDALPRDNERAGKTRAIRQRHLESMTNRMADLRAQYDLTNLRPGTADAAMSFTRDLSFPDLTNPNRIQVITVLFSYDPDPKPIERRAWQTRLEATFDFAALAALLK